MLAALVGLIAFGCVLWRAVSVTLLRRGAIRLFTGLTRALFRVHGILALTRF